MTEMESMVETAGKPRARSASAISARTRSVFTLAIRPAVSLALLIALFAFSQARLNDVWAGIVDANPGFIVLTILLILVALVISAIKWGILLKAQGNPVALPYLFNTYLVGLFFNNFLPANIGGDVVRVADVAKRTGKPAESAASVIAERLLAGLALALTAMLGLVLSLQVSGQFTLVVVGLTFFFMIVLGLIASQAARAPAGALVRRFVPQRWSEKIAQVVRSMAAVIRSPSTFVWVMLWSFAFQFALVLVNIGIFYALGINHLSLTTFLLFVPIIFAIQLLPISVNGLGVREGAYVYFFGTVGVGSVQAITASLIFWVLVMIVSLPGGLIFASRRYT